MDIRTYPRGADAQLTPHFHLREVECRCGRCPDTRIDLDHMERMERLRVALGCPVRITSGFRCPAHNAAVGGHPSSEHMDGTATDSQVPGVSPDRVADQAEEIGFGGIGRYDTFTHTDSRLRLSRWDRRTARA